MVCKTLKILLILCTVSFLPAARSQDLTNIGKQKPFDYTGSLSVKMGAYTHTGNDSPRNDPFNWTIIGSPTIIIYGISFPFSFLFSSQNQSYTQPFNQYGLSPTYKWITFHAGYRNVSFSPYTLGGITFLGGGIELKPGKFRFSAVYGRIRKPVDEDTNRREVVPSFKRMLAAIKVGAGSQYNYIDFSIIKGWDVDGSIAELSSGSNLRPQENLVLGLSGRARILKKVSFQLDGAVSAYTKDTKAQPYDEETTQMLSPIFNWNIASQVLTAFQTSLAYNEKNFGIKLQYKRIDPDYKSMGANYIQSDIEAYTIEPNFSLFKQKLRLGGSVGLQHDNLLDQKSATTKRTIGSVNLSYNPVQQYGLDIQFANYGVAQKAGIRPVNDTSRVAQANLNFNISNRLTLMDKVKVMNFMFIVTYQMLNDQNQFTSDYTESKVFFTNLSFSYAVLESGTSVNAGLAFSNNKMSAFKTQMIGPSAGISREIIKKKLSGNANASYMLSRTNGSSSGGVFNATLGLNYRPYKKHSFNLNINMINNNSSISPDGTFTEFRFNLGYNFQLK
jgi:hypothetical protein